MHIEKIYIPSICGVRIRSLKFKSRVEEGFFYRNYLYSIIIIKQFGRFDSKCIGCIKIQLSCQHSAPRVDNVI